VVIYARLIVRSFRPEVNYLGDPVKYINQFTSHRPVALFSILSFPFFFVHSTPASSFWAIGLYLNRDWIKLKLFAGFFSVQSLEAEKGLDEANARLFVSPRANFN
jgi:hypothetical protein